MPPAEWIHRARQSALIGADRLRPRPPAAIPLATAVAGWPRPDGAPALITPDQVAQVAALPGAVEAARAHADRLLGHGVAYFGYPTIAIGGRPDWHRDGPTGHTWPDAHWSAVNHRELGLNPKWIWELGRHRVTLALARAWRLTDDERYSRAATAHLESFLDQTRPGRGIHWRSGLELGVRLICWAFVVEFLRSSPHLTADLRQRLVDSVSAHLSHLRRHLSRHSSANNHLIGEVAGLAVGGMCFPEVPDAAEHAQVGLAELGQALGSQVLPDGLHAEQAVGYHGFVLELGLCAVACLRRRDLPVPTDIAEPLAGIADLLGVVASDGLTLPRIGDEDEGLGIDLDSGIDEAERLRFRLRAAAALLGTAPARLDPGLDEPTIWLAGTDAARRTAERPSARPGGAVFPAGGLAVLRSRPVGLGEVRVVFDAGPLGLAPMAAHGHADLLALCMSVAGREVLIDPGTFTYFGDGRWRDYGRSTAAHSTLRIDGREQADPVGRFMWRHTPRAHLGRVDLTADGGTARGHHDAYSPVRHHRTVALEGAYLRVEDLVQGPPGDHRLELRWQLAPGEVIPIDRGWRWSADGVTLVIQVDGVTEREIAVGREGPPAGWMSEGLEDRRPSVTLIAATTGGLPHAVRTDITIHTGP